MKSRLSRGALVMGLLVAMACAQVATVGPAAAVLGPQISDAPEITAAAESPAVSQAIPGAGPTTGGTTIKILGKNLTGATAVAVNGTPATNLVVTSPTSLTAVTPWGAVGPATITVTTPAGTATRARVFTYVQPTASPVIKNVTPTSGPATGGTLVTITGENFSHPTSVFFGGKPATAVTVVSATTLKAVAPAAAGGVVDVDVKTSGGREYGRSLFHYIDASKARPTIESITPAQGPALGGTKVTLKGANFVDQVRVKVGGRSATDITVVDANTVTFLTPEGIGGPADVGVTTPGGSATAAGAFSYPDNEICGDVTKDITLTADRVWVVPRCVVNVAAGATMTIEAGAIVKFSEHAHLTSFGKLVVAGNASAPVVLTSIHDDSVGGDTNNNGDATVPKSGDWSGVFAEHSDKAASTSITGARIRYGKFGVTVFNGRSTELRDNVIEHATYDGISYQLTTANAEPATFKLVVTGNTVTECGSVPVQLDFLPRAPVPPLRDLSGNTATGCRMGNYLRLSSYEARGDQRLDFDSGAIPTVIGLTGMTVAQGASLTIPAGAVVKFDTSSERKDNGIHVEGSLITAGTEAAPVILTDLRDDSVGGDTNNDGATTQPAERSWSGVVAATPKANISLQNTQIRYARAQ